MIDDDWGKSAEGADFFIFVRVDGGSFRPVLNVWLFLSISFGEIWLVKILELFFGKAYWIPYFISSDLILLAYLLSFSYKLHINTITSYFLIYIRIAIWNPLNILFIHFKTLTICRSHSRFTYSTLSLRVVRHRVGAISSPKISILHECKLLDKSQYLLILCTKARKLFLRKLQIAILISRT